MAVQLFESFSICNFVDLRNRYPHLTIVETEKLSVYNYMAFFLGFYRSQLRKIKCNCSDVPTIHITPTPLSHMVELCSLGRGDSRVMVLVAVIRTG